VVPHTDYELLEAWRGGDALAGKTLVRKYTPLLHRFFVTKAPEHVEDLLQATFLAAVESRNRFESRARFGTFLLAIGRNLLLKQLRKRFRGDRAVELTRACAAQFTVSHSLGVASRQELRLLLDAIRRIPIEHQLVLELHYWEEIPIAEIAVVLGVAPGTVKSRMARAREALRGMIEARTADSQFECLRGSTFGEFEDWAAELKRAVASTSSD
jgi:RNA polymerase sigma factor (sigma-70 family)